MVRPDVAGTRIERATVWLDDARQLLDQPAPAYIAATKDRAAWLK